MRGLHLPASIAATLGVFVAVGTRAASAAEGMPQLDFGNKLTLSQVVWLAIIFFALYMLLDRWALPKVGGVLAHRAATIGGDLEAARLAKAEADAAVAEFVAASHAAAAEAQRAISGSVDAAKAEAASQAAVANADLDRQLAAAEQRIGAARAAGLGALREVANETAIAVIQRLTGYAPDAHAVDHEVGAVLAATGRG